MGEAEEEVGGAASVGALHFAELVGCDLALVEGGIGGGGRVLGEHQAESAHGGVQLGGGGQADADCKGELTLCKEEQTSLAG